MRFLFTAMICVTLFISLFGIPTNNALAYPSLGTRYCGSGWYWNGSFCERLKTMHCITTYQSQTEWYSYYDSFLKRWVQRSRTYRYPVTKCSYW